MRHHSPRLLPKMHSAKQRLSYMTLQNHYPNTAGGVGCAVFLSVIYLVGGVQATRLPLLAWATVFLPGAMLSFGFTLFLRRFNLAEHERKSWDLRGMALDLITGPVFVVAGAAQYAGRPLVYVVTPKGDAATTDGLKSFRAHLGWAAVVGVSIAPGITFGQDYWTFYFWAGAIVLICLTPILLLIAGIRRYRASEVSVASAS